MEQAPIKHRGRLVFQVPEIRRGSCTGCLFEHALCGPNQVNVCNSKKAIFVTDLEAYQVAQVTRKLMPK